MSTSNGPTQAVRTAALDPLSQYNLLLENLNDILKNLDYLAKKVGIVSITQVPCDVAKFVTTQICSGNVSVDVNKLSGMIQSKVGTMSQEIAKRVQSGGSQVGGEYQYIVNPETGRKVSIHSKKGREVIKKYINMIS